MDWPYNGVALYKQTICHSIICLISRDICLSHFPGDPPTREQGLKGENGFCVTGKCSTRPSRGFHGATPAKSSSFLWISILWVSPLVEAYLVGCPLCCVFVERAVSLYRECWSMSHVAGKKVTMFVFYSDHISGIQRPRNCTGTMLHVSMCRGEGSYPKIEIKIVIYVTMAALTSGWQV